MSSFCNRLWCDGKQILDAGSWILDEILAQIRNPESVWMDHLCINPLVTIKEIRRVTGVSDATAGRLVKKMIELGVLSEITGYAPNRKFLYEDYFLAIDSSSIVFREKVHLT